MNVLIGSRRAKAQKLLWTHVVGTIIANDNSRISTLDKSQLGQKLSSRSQGTRWQTKLHVSMLTPTRTASEGTMPMPVAFTLTIDHFFLEDLMIDHWTAYKSLLGLMGRTNYLMGTNCSPGTSLALMTKYRRKPSFSLNCVFLGSLIDMFINIKKITNLKTNHEFKNVPESKNT